MTTSIETEEINVNQSNCEDKSKPGTTKDVNDKAESGSDSSENDFEVDGEFPEKSVRKPYTYQEDKEILEFLLQKENIFKVYSISLWKYFEKKKKKPKRTYQSLKNRFLRNIKPNIFTAFSHLINDEDEVEKILIKFPELKSELKEQETSLRKEPPLTEKIFQNINFMKSVNNKRTVKINKNEITVAVNVKNSHNSSVPVLGEISKRFEKVKKRNEEEVCFTCGRFYREDNDILNSYSFKTDKNSQIKIINIFSNKSNNRNTTVSPRCNPESSGSQNLLSFLENSQEPNSVEDDIEVSEAPMTKRSKKDKSSDNSDSDIEIIYDQSMKTFPELIGTKEEKTLERKYLKKHGFNADVENSLDYFFLETPRETENSTPDVEENRTPSPTSSSA